MKLFIETIPPNIFPSLIYREDSFITTEQPKSICSLQLNYIQLELDKMGRIIGVNGYSPLNNWQPTDKLPEPHQIRTLRVILDESLNDGVSYDLSDDPWPMYINTKKGWVCLGDPSTVDHYVVECAPGCIITLKDREIVAVWLKPKKLPPLKPNLFSCFKKSKQIKKINPIKETKNTYFSLHAPQKDQHFCLLYSQKEEAFDIAPHFSMECQQKNYSVNELHAGAGFAVIIINHLKLEIAEEGSVLYAWGYCSIQNSLPTSDYPKNYAKKNLKYKGLVQKNSCYALNNQDWPTYINQEKGWVCIGDPNIENKELIEFAPNSIASLIDQEIKAIWLKPEFIPA